MIINWTIGLGSADSYPNAISPVWNWSTVAVASTIVVGKGPFCFTAVQTYSGGLAAVELHSGGANAAQTDCT